MRHALGTTVAAAVLAIAVGAGAEPSQVNCNQPNILFILSDDHAWTHYGFMRELHESKDGSPPSTFLYQRDEKTDADKFPTRISDPNPGATPVPTTPGLDRLARAGVVFPFGHAGSSVCHPSLQATLTSRWQSHFTSNYHRGVGEPSATSTPYPFFMPELIEAARREAADPALWRYRTLGYGKIWTQPTGERGYFEAGFDCSWRPGSNKPRRLDVQPLLDFMAGEIALTNPEDGTSFAPDASGLFRCRHADTCGTNCKDPVTGADEAADPWATRDVEGALPSTGDHNFADTRRPWLIWYSPWTPHSPTNGKKVFASAEKEYTKTVNQNRCDKYFPKCQVPVLPETDHGPHPDPYSSYPGTTMERLHDITNRPEGTLDAGGDKPTKDRAYVETVMLLDYWIGQILDYLETTNDPRGCSGKKLIDTTLIFYLTDNGWHLPSSKKSSKENGHRTPILVSYGDAVAAAGYNPNQLDDLDTMVSARDIVPTMVDYATTGLAAYDTCAIQDGITPAGAAPKPRKVASGLCNGSAQCGCLAGRSLRCVIAGHGICGQPAGWGGWMLSGATNWRRWMLSEGTNKKKDHVQARRADHRRKIYGDFKCRANGNNAPFADCFSFAVDLRTDPDSKDPIDVSGCETYYGCILAQFGTGTDLQCENQLPPNDPNGCG
jgi:arylsulfatase A-like enzyme